MIGEDWTPKRGNWFADHKDHWLGFATIACVWSLIEAFKDDSLSHSFPAKFFLSLFGFVSMANCVALFLLIIFSLFNRDFKMSRYMNILVVSTFIIVLFQIISLALDFVRPK